MSKTLKPHPLAELLPMMSDAEYAALKLDISTNKQRDPIVLLDGKILDGRNRYRACVELKIEPKVIDYKAAWGDPIQYVRSKAQHRHMSESQRACVAINFGEPLAASLRNFGGNKGAADTGTTPYVTNSDLGAIFGCSADYVTKARGLYQQAPKLFAEVFEGAKPVYVAEREYKRTLRAKALKAKARVAARVTVGDQAWQLITGDVIESLQKLRREGVRPRLIFADPRYNIGIDYGEGVAADLTPESEYLAWCAKWLGLCAEILADDGAIFVMIDAPHLAALELILGGVAIPGVAGLNLHRRNVIIWPETFAQHQSGNFTQAWRPIAYYTKHHNQFVFHGDQILVPSARQTTYGDKRADPAGKVPTNIWSDIHRMVDNDAERIPGFPTQLPERLVARIVQACSDPGDIVLDPFNGSGTTGRAAIRHGRRYIGIDKSGEYVSLAHASLRVLQAQLAEGK